MFAPKLRFCLLLLVCIYQSAYSQATRQGKEQETNSGQVNRPNEDAKSTSDTASLTMTLVGGGEIVVDEVTEDKDGYWYKRGNISTFIERAKVARIDRPKFAEASASLPIEGNGQWKLSDATKVQDFFLNKFNRPLPLSAFGQSELHTRWGWDHRNGMDVGVHPDSVEGRALITFLRDEEIPFLAFRSAIPGIATGPHIHIGNRSHRLSLH